MSNGEIFEAEKVPLLRSRPRLERERANFERLGNREHVCRCKSAAPERRVKELRRESGLVRVVVLPGLLDFLTEPIEYVECGNWACRRFVQNVAKVHLCRDDVLDDRLQIGNGDFREAVWFQHVVESAQNTDTIVPVIVFQVMGAIDSIELRRLQ